MSWNKGVGILILTIFLTAFHARGQRVAEADTLLHADDLSEVVVTATRSDRKMTDVPIPVTIIGQDQIQSSGASRLDEILSEQTGLAIINNHGIGVQIQGMGPEYCLILINGEPVIGRTAGTLDLRRITLNNVERIEIIKGPSSSLYGSDALAGVINIITKGNEQSGIYAQTKYGAYQTTDHTLSGTMNWKKGHAAISLNRYHTNGYDLLPDSYGKTVDPYTDYSVNAQFNYHFSPRFNFLFNGNFFDERIDNNYLASSGKDSVMVTGESRITDAYLSPVLTYRFSPKWKLKLRNYWSVYKTKSDLYAAKADTAYDNTFFHQQLWKEELQSEHILTQQQILTIGAGMNKQSVTASRYPEKETLTDYFLYAQHEWHPTARWNILTGLRYDHPTAYHAQLSPKMAGQYKLDKHWAFRASVGMGYKAPDFRQLYLTFSNPIVGYSVLGTKAIQSELKKMQAEGLIKQVYISPEEMAGDLKPESSIAYNLGGSYTGNTGWKVSVNLFRNDIRDLIDTRTIAMKTNGQPLYSYYNIHRVLTEGVEINAHVPFIKNQLILNGGYQFLLALDKDVVADINAGKQFIRDPETLATRKLTLSEYGGLFNRSKHSFNLKLFYQYRSWDFNLRMMYRGKYGFADMNGDVILDADNEYTPGYALVHLNAGKDLLNDKLKLQFGIKNIFNYTDPQHLAYEPGRTWYLSASIHLFKSKKQKK